MPAKELNLSGSTKNKTQNQSTWKNFNWRICELFLEDINFFFIFMVRKDDQVNNLLCFFSLFGREIIWFQIQYASYMEKDGRQDHSTKSKMCRYS